MAKWYDCCGGKGKHLGNCEIAARAAGTGSLRTRTPGTRQGMLLDRIKNGKQPFTGGGDLHLDKKSMQVMVDRGWVRNTGGDSYEITDAGNAAYELWRDN